MAQKLPKMTIAPHVIHKMDWVHMTGRNNRTEVNPLTILCLRKYPKPIPKNMTLTRQSIGNQRFRSSYAHREAKYPNHKSLMSTTCVAGTPRNLFNMIPHPHNTINERSKTAKRTPKDATSVIRREHGSTASVIFGAQVSHEWVHQHVRVVSH